MNDIIAVEKLSEKNFDDFVELIKIFADFEKLTPPDEAAKKRLKKDGLGKNARYEAYLTRINGRYVAYTIFFMTYGSFSAMPKLFLEDIFILEDFRRKGLGKKILDFVINIARKRKCRVLDLNVIDWNKNAINFYRKNGFKHVNWDLYRLELKKTIDAK